MSELKLIVSGHLLTIANKPLLTSGSKNVDSISTTFDSTWDAYAKMVVLCENGKCTPVFMGSDKVSMPPEVMNLDGEMNIGIIGFKQGSNITTNIVTYKIDKGYVVKLDPPTNDIYESILSCYAAIETTVNLQKERLDNLASLTEGSTTGDAELIDARVGYKGTQYKSVGAAARMEVQQLAEGKVSYADVIPITPELTCDGYVYKTGRFNVTTSAKATDFISLAGITKIIYTTSMNSEGYELAFYDSDKNIMSNISVIGRASTSANLVNITGDILKATYFRISVYGNTSVYSCRCIGNPTFSKKFEEAYGKNNVLNGSNILAFGDSITDCANLQITDDKTTTYYLRDPSNSYLDKNGDTVEFNMWCKLLNDNNNISELRNYAKSGASWHDMERESGNERQNLSYQVTVAINDLSNANNVFKNTDFTPDITVFALGINDGTPNDTFEDAISKIVYTEDGTINSEDTISALDCTKFCESALSAILRIKSKFPATQIFMVLPLQTATSTSYTATRECLLKVAEFTSTIVIDGAHNSGITRIFNTKGGLGTYLKDGLHPNELGQKLLYRLIVSSLKSHFINLNNLI